MQVICVFRRKASRLLLSLTLAIPGSIMAQVCNSTGADGALIYNAAGTYEFDPVAAGLNAAGDNVFHFTSINIGAGVTVRLRSSKMRAQRPVVFLVSGPVTIAGNLDLSGSSGHPGTDQMSLRSPSEPGPGGFPGGASNKPGDAPQPGAGPGGGGLGVATAGTPGTIQPGTPQGCPAAFAAQPYLHTSPFFSPSDRAYDPAHCPVATVPYGNASLQPLVGGSGGSGARVTGGSFTGGGGGAGGGAIRICSEVSISLAGQFSSQPSSSINANGGSGGLAYGANGGPGAGGAIHLQAPAMNLLYAYNWTPLSARGGSPAGGASGDVASNGRIRIDTNSPLPPDMMGTVPLPAIGPFAAAPLPQGPTVRIVSINGVNVSANPVNSASSPDVTLTSSLPVPVVVQTTNVPNGTVARFYVSSDAAAADFVQNATINNNTATLSVPLPQGVSHLVVRATF